MHWIRISLLNPVVLNIPFNSSINCSGQLYCATWCLFFHFMAAKRPGIPRWKGAVEKKQKCDGENPGWFRSSLMAILKFSTLAVYFLLIWLSCVGEGMLTTLLGDLTLPEVQQWGQNHSLPVYPYPLTSILVYTDTACVQTSDFLYNLPETSWITLQITFDDMFYVNCVIVLFACILWK